MLKMYRIFQFSLESNISLAWLPRIQEGEKSRGTISFSLREGSSPVPSHLKWRHHWRLDHEVISLSYGRSTHFHYLRFPDLADFCISLDGKQITCFPLVNVSRNTIIHLLLDQVIPRVIQYFHHEAILHGSGIQKGGPGLCFFGETGSGKSTIATVFLERGYSLLSDDCLLLRKKENKLLMEGSYQSVRLWDDSVQHLFSQKNIDYQQMSDFSTKKRLLLKTETKGQRKDFCIQAVFFLKPFSGETDREISVKQLSGAKVVKKLIQYSFLLDVGDIGRAQTQMEQLVEFARAPVPFYDLQYPFVYQSLDRVCSLIEETTANRKVVL